MEGIQFMVDASGRKTAVLIDLKKHGDLWEHVYDSFIARRRQKEPRETLEAVKQQLRRKGKIEANG